MRTKNLVNWTLVFMVVVALSTVLAIRNAGADCGGGNGSDDPPAHGCDDNGNGGGPGGDGGDADQDQDQRQGQAQEQDQGQAQEQANQQDVTFVSPDELKTTGRAYVSSGDATAQCQKFIGVSSGWLGGALGLGFNLTDRDCMALQIYDRLAASNIQVANKALCSSKTMAKVYGKDQRQVCESDLNASYQAYQDAQEGEVEALRRQVRELSQASRTANTASQGAKTGETADSVHNGPPQDVQDGRSTYQEYPRTSENPVVLERVGQTFTGAECDERERRKDAACFNK